MKNLIKGGREDLTRTERFLPIGFVQDKSTFPHALEFLNYACAHQVSQVELKYELALDERYNLRGPIAQQIRRVAEQNKISLSVHAPYDDGVSLGDVDADIKERTREQMRLCLEFAQKIGAKYITVHGGFYEIEHQQIVGDMLGRLDRVTVKDCVPYAEYRDLKNRTIDELGWLIDEAKPGGIKIALENFHDFSSFKVRFPIVPADFRECRAALGDTFYINFDSGHAHSTGIHISDFIEDVGVHNIIGTHLHDNDRLSDQHLPILKGTIDFPSFFEQYFLRGWNFPINLENKHSNDLLQSLAVVRSQNWEKWREAK